MKVADIGVTLTVFLAASAAQAAQCIDAKSAKNGFILERPGIHSEYRPAASGMVAVANTYESETPQSQFLFGGLIEVFRDSSTGRLAMIPLADLRKLFALKAGTKSKTAFVELAPNTQPKGIQTIELSVTGKDTVSLGDCKYAVLAVAETITNEAGETLDDYTALYSPDLQAVLARRYDAGKSSESVVGYETIKPLGN
jgi:hypothetical protein